VAYSVFSFIFSSFYLLRFLFSIYSNSNIKMVCVIIILLLNFSGLCFPYQYEMQLYRHCIADLLIDKVYICHYLSIIIGISIQYVYAKTGIDWVGISTFCICQFSTLIIMLIYISSVLSEVFCFWIFISNEVSHMRMTFWWGVMRCAMCVQLGPPLATWFDGKSQILIM
jgi:hypothetical protein